MDEIYDGDIYTLTDETGKESEFELILRLSPSRKAPTNM